MSELKRVIEQCDACGRFRYPNDLIAYDCHGCGEWAEKQIIALRAEVARSQNFASGLQRELTETIDKWNAEVAALKAENQKMHHDWMADNAEMEFLKDELKKHTEPLTDEQAERAFAIAKESGVGECDTLAHGVQGIDAAIRRVRRG